MLQISNFQTGYDNRPLVTIPSLHLEKSDKCLITGPSGTGKTTLLYALAGLGDVLSGTITLNGTDLYQLAPAQRDSFRGKHIGMVFQTLHLVKSLTVWQNLQLASFVTNQAFDQGWAHHLLEALAISHLKERAATDISQGQAQRVAITRALLHKPSLLLADEPTSSLDDAAAANVLHLLLSLCDEAGCTLLVSSHDARIKQAFEHKIVLGETQ